MRLPGIMLLAAILVMAAQVRAEDNPEQGKAAYANCVSCHGVQAVAAVVAYIRSLEQ